MKAAIIEEFKQPLVLRDVDVPVPDADDVLIKIEACGVCHSDLSVVEGGWPQLKKLIKRPLIPGHEIVGRVVEKGANVSDLAIGDRVGVAWLHWSCGLCELCQEGFENLCPKQAITGVSVHGGYAEFIKAKATHAIAIPAAISSEEAAPLLCAGVTAYRAVRSAAIQPGQRVAVFGIGGLGHIAVQLAGNSGAKVIAVDIAEEKLKLAHELGAAQTLNALTEDIAQAIRSQGGVHAAIVTSSSTAAYTQAFYAVRPAGTLVVAGLPTENLSFPAIMMREMVIRSVATGTRADLRQVLALAAQKKIRCLVETCHLEEINQVFDQMRHGKIAGRMVIKMPDPRSIS